MNPVICIYGAEMTLAAVIFDGSSLLKVLAHLGLPTAFPVIKPPRPPPQQSESQLDEKVEK